MKHVIIALAILASMPALADDGRNPADDASERTPPSIVQGKTYDGGPMIWTWDMIKGIFHKEKK